MQLDPANSDAQDQLNRRSEATANDLQNEALKHQALSRLSLPEIKQASDMVGKMLPAGNIPGLILSGLARLPGRKPPPDTMQRDIDILFKGINQAIDKAIFGTFFAGPAAVIWGYQNILKLAGKEAEDAFPEGTWQFYVDYALREDTARHANETHGFDTLLRKHDIVLPLYDRMASLVMTAIHVLHDYDGLLENEWRERYYPHLLEEITRGTPHEASIKQVYRGWASQRPYKRERDARDSESYIAYRRRKFDEYFESILYSLDRDIQKKWLEAVREAKTTELPAYQKQMSILGYLKPGTHYETREPIPIEKAQIGVIYEGHYYLIPVCERGTRQPIDGGLVRQLMAAIIANPATEQPSKLNSIAQIKRAALPDLYSSMPDTLVKNLMYLRYTPVIINFDVQDGSQNLSDLRQAERGVGDHALTIFDTKETLVFDQSHIYFDGAWGAALAEIINNGAVSWAIHFRDMSPTQPTKYMPYSLDFSIDHGTQQRISKMPRITPEVSAETAMVQLKPILGLRKVFKQRNDLLTLTVNDLLILYRAIHAISYQPDPDLIDYLQDLSHDRKAGEGARLALEAIHDHKNPAILIPIDASERSPSDRLYPMSFDVPVAELNLIELHEQVIQALYEYNVASGNRSSAYTRFDNLQREYLASLAGFGAISTRAKEIAISGEAASVGAIKLLAHMPTPLQRLLDNVPGRFEILSDIIKGSEVFSNVGAVAPTSTLTRFITAKDDNERKTLAWGVITDANGVMRISLRDFRPHVGLLHSAGYRNVAVHITQHYLDSYAAGLNTFISDLHQITMASRETRFVQLEE